MSGIINLKLNRSQVPAVPVFFREGCPYSPLDGGSNEAFTSLLNLVMEYLIYLALLGFVCLCTTIKR